MAAGGGVACEHVVVRKFFLSLLCVVNRPTRPFRFLGRSCLAVGPGLLASIVDMVDINDGGEMRYK